MVFRSEKGERGEGGGTEGFLCTSTMRFGFGNGYMMLLHATEHTN